MKKSKKTESQQSADKKGKERIKRFEENQEIIKKGKKPKKEVEECDDGERCVTCWQKIGDDDWKEIQYFYNTKDKVSKSVFKKYSPIEGDEKD
jgi:hypothetical protein